MTSPVDHPPRTLHPALAVLACLASSERRVHQSISLRMCRFCRTIVCTLAESQERRDMPPRGEASLLEQSRRKLGSHPASRGAADPRTIVANIVRTTAVFSRNRDLMPCTSLG